MPGVCRPPLRPLPGPKQPNKVSTFSGPDHSYVARILRLTLLAPDLIEAILESTEPDGLSLAKLMSLPPSWQEQREHLGFPH